MKINQKTLEYVAKFILKLNLFLIPFYLFITFRPSFGLENVITSLMGYVFSLPANGNELLITKTETLVISWDCIGMKSLLFFLALVFAYGRLRFKPLIFFSIVIFLYHLFRIYFLILVALTYGVNTYAIIHRITWYTSILVTLGLWIVYIRLSRIKLKHGRFGKIKK